MANNPYALFKTDEDREKQGEWFQYGNFRVKLARAGGANKAFAKKLEQLSRPYQRLIRKNKLPADTADEIMKEVFLTTIINGWKYKDEDGKFKDGIQDEEGKVLPFKAGNVRLILNALPDLFADFQEKAMDSSYFLAEELEEDAKN